MIRELCDIETNKEKNPHYNEKAVELLRKLGESRSYEITLAYSTFGIWDCRARQQICYQVYYDELNEFFKWLISKRKLIDLKLHAFSRLLGLVEENEPSEENESSEELDENSEN